MPSSYAFEILLEAQGETLTVGDVRLTKGGLDRNRIEGLCIGSGQSECLKATEMSDSGTAGTLSLFAGCEKVGTLSWDSTDPFNNVPVDWTPLSKNFRTSIMDSFKAGTRLGGVKLRVARAFSASRSPRQMSVSTGQLGFAGI